MAGIGDSGHAAPGSARIVYQATPEVRAILGDLGRTEDVKLSADGSRVAIVEYLRNRIVLFAIRMCPRDEGGKSPAVEITDYSVVTSQSLGHPHGVWFLNNETLLVCNRAGDVCLFRVPAPGELPRERSLRPLSRINGQGLLRATVQTPGSLDGYATDDGRFRVLVCNNHWHFVSAHLVAADDPRRIHNQGVIIERDLRIPDGVSISRDARWIAISNHVDGEVLIFRNTPALNRRTRADAHLQGLVCPHGIRFTSDGRVIVADAASPYLHVFECRGDWQGVYAPARTVRMLDDETFFDGRYDVREGGLKGIDIDTSGRVLVTTHMRDVLAFHDLDALLSRHDGVDAQEIAVLRQERDESLQRQKRDVLKRRWSVAERTSWTVRGWRRSWTLHRKDARRRRNMSELALQNRRSRETASDPGSGGPAVSMTTHGHRLELAFYALESIASGDVKPARLILWLSDQATCARPPETLQRLAQRGLEIRHTEDVGPHTKYFPYLEGARTPGVPLVTADDDTLYPRDWLRRLLAAYAEAPAVIHCFRARRMLVRDGRFQPYSVWPVCKDTRPSHCNFITGVSGVIYPPEYLDFLHRQGSAFQVCCPHADDIWLTANAIRGGVKVAQVDAHPHHFPAVLGTQHQRLFDINVTSGLNQVQLRRTFSEADLHVLATCAHLT
jgi:hypothetical protein